MGSGRALVYVLACVPYKDPVFYGRHAPKLELPALPALPAVA